MFVMDDDELVAAWRAGDQNAGRVLLDRHYATVHRFFVNKVRDDPDGLVHDTLLECYGSIARYKGPAPFRCFLLGIARNLLRRHWARVARDRAEPIDELSIAELGAGPSTLIRRSQDENRLVAALREIRLDYQEILELYYWERLTGPELGELLGLTEAGARARLHRARQSLYERFRELESHAGVPQSSDVSIEQWAACIREGLNGRRRRDGAEEDGAEEE